MIIYMAVNTQNNKVYIGKTVSPLYVRKSAHLGNRNNPKDNHRPFYRALNKYGPDAFEWIILEEDPQEPLEDAERFWIAYFKSLGIPLYNLTDGGEGTPGRRVSESTKALLSIRNKGRVLTDATRARMSESRKAAGVQPPRFQHTDDSRLAVSKRMKGRDAKTYDVVLESPSGIRYGPITNLHEFALQHGICPKNIYAFAKGKYTTLNGWTCVKPLDNDLFNVREKKRQSRDANNASRIRQQSAKQYDVVLQSPDGKIYGPITNLRDFSLQHGLEPKNMDKLIRGTRKSHLGWKCLRGIS